VLEAMDVLEATVEYPWSLRRKESLIVPEGANLVYFTDRDRNLVPSDEVSTKKLNPGDPNDFRIIRKLVEKAIDIRLREITGKPKQNNTYLLEEPINLFSCESAKLLLGFSVKVVPTADSIKVEAKPE